MMEQIIVFHFSIKICPSGLHFMIFVIGLFVVQKILLKLLFTWKILALEIILELNMLKRLINFLAEILKDLWFGLAVLVQFIENCTVSGFFDLIAINRWLIAFFSCQWDSLFIFEYTLDFFVIEMSESIKIFAEYSKNWLFEYFRNVAMKLVIFWEHFDFILKLIRFFVMCLHQTKVTTVYHTLLTC